MKTTSKAYQKGHDHGFMVPSKTPSSEMAWCDLRATSEKIQRARESEYVRGHMAGQADAAKMGHVADKN